MDVVSEIQNKAYFPGTLRKIFALNFYMKITYSEVAT